ncbi:uncharacterized protein LOC122074163 [Macadamia integrifolia]|uniref:uncharacterized protein LOC122074163 n=1 Tax=Macadamia integrifolia TaxID=60698 RepID=UPI001C4F0A15|nr:uncharacterized protein LOC122074163 [Macadamia integrifolia]
MGFSDHFISGCISSVHYSILVNGAVRCQVNLTRGIRQGDPFSLALFVLCSQALSNILNSAAGNNGIQGIKVKRRAPPLSHLLFADDCLLFSEVKLNELQNLKDYVNLYCRASGQCINMAKSSMCFSPNTASRIKRWFSIIFKIPYGDGPSKYLGLPSEIGVNKVDLFHSINDKASAKMHGWSKALLSYVGHETLIKSMIQPSQNYVANHFKLPQALHNRSRKDIAHFFWGSSEESRKVHWLSWSKLSQSKENGGLGLRDPATHNKALLSKVA